MTRQGPPRPVVLCILDGWGERSSADHNAIELAATPTWDGFMRDCPHALIDAFCSGTWVAEVVARGDTKATVVGHDGLRFDLRVVPGECYGNVLQHFTGSKDHNIALREDAQRRGLSISEYGVTTVETGEVVTHASEDELYAFLGYAFVPPELREGIREIAASRERALPELVELGDLRGEMHSQAASRSRDTSRCSSRRSTRQTGWRSTRNTIT